MVSNSGELAFKSLLFIQIRSLESQELNFITSWQIMLSSKSSNVTPFNQPLMKDSSF